VPSGSHAASPRQIGTAPSGLPEAEKQLDTALNRLAGHPVPIVTWKIYSMLGRLRLRLGDGSAAEAFEKASTIVQMIAANIEEEKLRAAFLAAPAVREVFVKGSVRTAT
jgi:hypothetical protein